MSIDRKRLAALEEQALAELRDRIARTTYLKISEVCERTNLSRDKVDALPMEILPFIDFGDGTRHLKRFHPADVAALDAVVRAWRRAETEDRSMEFMEERRAMLAARDAAAIEVATQPEAAA